MSNRYVCVEVYGDKEIHASGFTSDYATFCGLDGEDSGSGQILKNVRKNAKINCPQCIAGLRTAWGYTEKDLSRG